jgi:Ribosomal protein L7/L12 dimerisation domain
MADLLKLADQLSSLTVLEAAELSKLLEDKWQLSNLRQLMVSVADIKNNLPGWPDEVVEEWLHWFANDICWPPPEPLGDHRWSGILGGRPLSWWKKVSWKKETVKCTPAKLSDKSRAIVIATIAEINNRTADAETQRRFKRAMDYILDNGVFPGVIVVMNVPSGLTLLDGNHRMSAFCGAQLMTDAAFERLQKKRPALEQDVWVGKHADGDVPLT